MATIDINDVNTGTDTDMLILALIKQDDWAEIRKTEEYKRLTKGCWFADFVPQMAMDEYFKQEFLLPDSLQRINRFLFQETFCNKIIDWIESSLSDDGFVRKNLASGREFTFRKKGHDYYFRVNISTIRSSWNYGGKQLYIQKIQKNVEPYYCRYTGRDRTTKRIKSIYIQKDIIGHQGYLYGDFYKKIIELKRMIFPSMIHGTF